MAYLLWIGRERLSTGRLRSRGLKNSSRRHLDGESSANRQVPSSLVCFREPNARPDGCWRKRRALSAPTVSSRFRDGHPGRSMSFAAWSDAMPSIRLGDVDGVLVVDGTGCAEEGDRVRRSGAPVFGDGRADRKLSDWGLRRPCQPLWPYACRPAPVFAKGPGRGCDVPGKGACSRRSGNAHYPSMLCRVSASRCFNVMWKRFGACRVKLNSPDRLNALCFANAASTCLVNT